jgi:hypothetical protein
MSTVPPIRREILIDADPGAAFEVFTAGIGPLGDAAGEGMTILRLQVLADSTRRRGSRPKTTPASRAASSPSPSGPGRS